MADREGARVHVGIDTEPGQGYDVIVRQGALEALAGLVTVAAPAGSYAVITPERLADSYGARARDALHTTGSRVELLPFDDSETRKTRETWAILTDRMIDLRFDRYSCVVAVGGGVTGDVAGFVAATYMRGIPVVQVPTTLLAMIDASVGGKTGLDTVAGKNLVGAFHTPAVVIADPAVLRTLPIRELRSGFAEAVKHGAILDAAYFDFLGRRADDLLALDPAAIEHLIGRSVSLKAGVVSDDPRERGRRAILNFGHTIGHALEHASGFALPHGFAVSVGMCIESSLGEATGVTRAGTTAAITQLLARLGLPTHATFEPDSIVHTMATDKKARAARPRFVLLRGIGECAEDATGTWTHAVDSDVLVTVLRDHARGGESASDRV